MPDVTAVGPSTLNEEVNRTQCDVHIRTSNLCIFEVMSARGRGRGFALL